MAAGPQPPMGGGPPPQAGGGPSPSSPPSQGPANQVQMALAQISQVLKRIATTMPAASAGLQKAIDGINEAQSAMVMQPKPPNPAGQNPPL